MEKNLVKIATVDGYALRQHYNLDDVQTLLIGSGYDLGSSELNHACTHSLYRDSSFLELRRGPRGSVPLYNGLEQVFLRPGGVSTLGVRERVTEEQANASFMSSLDFYINHAQSDRRIKPPYVIVTDPQNFERVTRLLRNAPLRFEHLKKLD